MDIVVSGVVRRCTCRVKLCAELSRRVVSHNSNRVQNSRQLSEAQREFESLYNAFNNKILLLVDGADEDAVLWLVLDDLAVQLQQHKSHGKRFGHHSIHYKLHDPQVSPQMREVEIYCMW